MLTNQVVTLVTQWDFAVVSPQPSCCVRSLSRSNRSSKSRSVFLVAMFRLKPVVRDFNPPLVTIEGPRSRFPVNGTRVCKENTIAERNVPVLSFVYHLLKSWTARVTNLRFFENTSGSLLRSKAKPQAAGNIIIIEFGASNPIYWWQYKI